MDEKRWRPAIVRILVFGVTAALLLHAFHGVDWHATRLVLSSVGLGAGVALVPFGIGLLLDASGVMLVARAAGIELRAVATLGVRVVSEAFHFGAPGGVVASEAAGLALFKTRCSLTTPEAAVVLAGRKQLVMRAHTVYLLVCASCGAASLAAMRPRAPSLVALSALVPLASSIALGFAMSRAPGLRDARPYVARFRKAVHLTTLATASFLAGWLIEAVETAVILNIAGATLPISSVLAVEGALSLARSAVAFVPGGFGVQDVGYATLLGATGVGSEHAAAFVLLKRAKELMWIAIGAGVATARRGERRRLRQAQPS